MIIALILALMANYFIITPIAFQPGFLFLYNICLLIVIIIESKIIKPHKIYDYHTVKGLMFSGNVVIFSGICILLIICRIAGSPMVNATDYHNVITLTQHTQDDLAGNIPDINMIKSVSLMDTASAEKLGDRTLGSLSELVSQYKVGDYYTICINGEVRKIAPLEYDGFFKWLDNDSIPGYVIVNPLNNEAEYVKYEDGIIYSPSACFSQNLHRHVWSSYPSTFLGDYSFQVDDEGTPYWVITTLDAKNIWSNKVPNGAIVVNASTGQMKRYTLNTTPEWIDLIYSGKTVETLYNRYGRYINGFLNFSKTGMTQVTKDYGYITMNDDVYIYTGITSVSSDESNLGFILVNTRTGDFDYYPIAGAEEYSAMGAAQGIVQNYGYTASFPSLMLIQETPTYVMVLKDANGLVKQYAMVNYANYTIATVGDTLDICLNNYSRLINGETPVTATEGNGIITNIEFITVDGETYCYIVTNTNEVYCAKFDPAHMLLNVGTEVELSNFEIAK